MLSFVLSFLLLFATSGDEGVGIDPNGGITAAAACGDEGNGLDPHGGPCPTTALTSNTDDGNGFDPHG